MPPRTLTRRLLPLAIGLALATGVAVGTVPPAPAWADPGAPTGRVIVKFEGDAEVTPQTRVGILRRSASRSGTMLTETRTLATGARVIEVRGETAQAAAARLATSEGVEYAVADRIIPTMRSAATPASSYAVEQWNLETSRPGLDVTQAWRLSRGSGVRVAVLDTGITSHRDLDGRVVGGYDFVSSPYVANDGDGRDADPTDPGDATEAGECGYDRAYRSSWHGTHVAGIVAATADDYGITGVAPSATVVPVRVMGKCGGTLLDLLDAMIWAAGGPVAYAPQNRHPAKVVNLSLGDIAPCDSATQSIINRVRHLGALPVVAAGNESGEVSWPANCDGVVSVAASTSRGELWEWSNSGDLVDVTAPGHAVLSTFNSGSRAPGQPSHAFASGTSMAAPHVSGVVALMLALQSSLLPPSLEGNIKRGVEAFPGECSGCGVGLLDARRSVDQVIHPQVSSAWLARSGVRGPLGSFRSQRAVAGGYSATFVQGYLTYHPDHGAFAAWGRIGAEWQRLGGVTTVGFALSDEQQGRAGHLQNRFVKGWILYSAQGAHLLDAERLTYWTKLSSADVATVGQLRTGTLTAGTTRSAHFTNGAIVHSSKGTYWMHSAIYRRHQALPSTTRNALGALTAVEAGGLFSGQRVSRFTGGAIYYAGTTGAWALSNEIDQRYRAAGVAVALGNPNGLQQTVRFGARKASFAKGAVYAHSTTGAWEVHGAIGRAFTAVGAENSRLELPTSGEIRSGSTIYQKFRGGRITYAGGKTTVTYS